MGLVMSLRMGPHKRWAGRGLGFLTSPATQPHCSLAGARDWQPAKNKTHHDWRWDGVGLLFQFV